MKHVSLILALSAATACARLQEPQIKVELEKADDSAEIASTHDTVVVTVTSKSGIGGARLIRSRESWPVRITIRLKLSGLESFGMDNGLIRFGTSLYRPKQVPYWRTGKSASDGNLEITITQTGELIEIAVPGKITEGNPESISFSWIDFFRD